MKTKFYISILLIILELPTLVYAESSENTKIWTVEELMKSLNSNSQKYTNDDNSYVISTAHRYTPSFEYMVYSYNPETKEKTDYTGWARTNMTVNGVFIEGSSTTKSKYYQIFDFNENGQLQAIYDKNEQLLTSYKYAEDGKMLVYDSQGNLIGAYNNWAEKMVEQTGAYDKELNKINTDGDYIAQDDKGNILGIYSQNGNVETFKYDKGGNLLAKYENGKQTYHRTSYTLKEANDATPNPDGTYSVRLSF